MKQIIVSLLLSYLRFFARLALKTHRPTVIGITGSYGKSSARTIIATIIKPYYPTREIYGNSETGVPLGILGMKVDSLGFDTPLRSIMDWLGIVLRAPFAINNLRGITYLIVEMGIDDPYPPKNMEYLLTIVKPEIAVFLNAGPVHTMQFEKLLDKEKKAFAKEEEKTDFLVQKIAEEKAKIITQSGCSLGIYNADNQYVVNAVQQEKKNESERMAPFGKDKHNAISYKSYSVSEEGTTYEFVIRNTTKSEVLSIKLTGYLLPESHQSTIAAGILVAHKIGLTTEQIKKQLEEKFSLPAGRASLLQGVEKSIIIDSSYNASRYAVESMLDLLAVLKKQTKRHTIFLFGDMRELGNEAKTEHEVIAKKIAGIADDLYCVGPLTKEFVSPHVPNAKWFDSAHSAGEYIRTHLPKHAIILVKGSQNTLFLEEAIKYLLVNKADEKKLCRQEAYWQKKKEHYFNNLN